ncbi:hypothetical protein ANTPLA_LOCUS6068 [Anthophora plagiata]
MEQPHIKYHIVPAIVTPIADMIKTVDHIQENPQCRDFEIELAKCIEVYGFMRGRELCTSYMLDMQECMYAEKQKHRAAIMRGEHMRQVKNGERQHQEMPLIFNI